MSKKKRITELYFNGEQNEEVQKKFTQWITDPRDSEEKENAVMELWDNIPEAHMTRTALDRAYNRTKSRIDRSGKRSHRSLGARVMRVAVMVMLPLLASVATFLYLDDRRGPVRFSEYFVPNASTDEIILPDNTTVKLNSGSTLIYPKTFKGPTREVFLTGEAIFTVAKNQAKPFIVQTSDMDVEVLGTIFNINAYSESDRTELTLSEGKVKATLHDGSGKSFILSPGEQLGFYRQTGQNKRVSVDAETIMSWTTGQLIFNDVPMSEIAKMIERKFGIAVFYNSGKYVNEYISAKFRHNEELEEILVVLQEIVPEFRYKFDEGELFIF